MEESVIAVASSVIEKRINEMVSDIFLMKNLILHHAEEVNEKRKEFSLQFLADFGQENEINHLVKEEFVQELDKFLLDFAQKHIAEDIRVHKSLWCLGAESVNEIFSELEEQKKDYIKQALSDFIFTFSDIVHLDDHSVQKFLREVDFQELAKALKLADDEVKEKIYRNMSKNAAEMLKGDIEYMGKVAKKEVLHSQTKICAIIKRLEESGEIVFQDFLDEMV